VQRSKIARAAVEARAVVEDAGDVHAAGDARGGLAVRGHADAEARLKMRRARHVIDMVVREHELGDRMAGGGELVERGVERGLLLVVGARRIEDGERAIADQVDVGVGGGWQRWSAHRENPNPRRTVENLRRAVDHLRQGELSSANFARDVTSCAA
jgi:hypothetical protein